MGQAIVSNKSGGAASAKPRVAASVNAGVAVPCGSIQLRMNTASPRTLQISTTTSAPMSWQAIGFHEGGGDMVLRSGTVAPGAWANVLSAFNFTTAGSFQAMTVFDTTSGRAYEVKYVVASAFNASPIMIYEV
jgi:hypothetical protein